MFLIIAYQINQEENQSKFIRFYLNDIAIIESVSMDFTINHDCFKSVISEDLQKPIE